jgi:3-dehydroquinate synthase
LAERSYDIEIGSGNLRQIGALLERLGRFSRALVITDSNVQELHAVAVAESLTEHLPVDIVSVAAGEESKSLGTAAGLWEGLIELGADRKSVVVAVGGGVVGDLAGFVAATYARGIRFVQVPTTLLAQVDSSVGGKVGINLTEAKNMVGAFLQPLAVLIDIDTLRTLPEREYVAGLGEVVKYGVILDAELFASSRPTSCVRTSVKRRACVPCSTMGTPSATPWRRSRTTSVTCTAKRWPSACSAPPAWPSGWAGWPPIWPSVRDA